MNAPAAAHELLPQVALRPIPEAFMQALQARFGAQCSTAAIVREHHGRDESIFVDVPPPQAVVFAESTQDVQDAVRLCAAHRVPIIPFGIGSSLYAPGREAAQVRSVATELVAICADSTRAGA